MVPTQMIAQLLQMLAALTIFADMDKAVALMCETAMNCYS